jgi:hypothetical protein
MKRKKKLIAGALLAGLMLAHGVTAYADVPTTVAFSGNLSDASGPIDGNVQVTFRLFDAETSGTELWTETHDLVADNGVVLAELGSAGSPLDDIVFDGSDTWLEVEVDGEVLSPRSTIGSVPYAIAASVADYLGPYAPADLQERVTGTCSAGSAIRSIASDGTVTCETDDDAGGDITGVTAGNGLQGGGTTGNPTLSVNFNETQRRISNSCVGSTAMTAVAANGFAVCQSFGDIDGVAAGTGLSGGGTTGSVSLDVDYTSTQARVTGTCAAGQALTSVNADGSVGCSTAGDITGVTAGFGLTGGATSGTATLNVDPTALLNNPSTSRAGTASIQTVTGDTFSTLDSVTISIDHHSDVAVLASAVVWCSNCTNFNTAAVGRITIDTDESGTGYGVTGAALTLFDSIGGGFVPNRVGLNTMYTASVAAGSHTFYIRGATTDAGDAVNFDEVRIMVIAVPDGA